MSRALGSLAAIGALWLPTPSHASPQLQLGILGGFYDSGSESIVTTSDIFTVVALGKVSATDVNETHYLSIAINPALANDPSLNLGSFDLDGSTKNVVSGLTFGTPPIGATGNPLLGPHGVFETYFHEQPFTFDPANTVTDINTQDNPATPLDTSGNDLYFVKFEVDKTLLSPGYQLHFDLYNTKVKNGGAITRDDFAPFSHDAQSIAPEASSALVWILGLTTVGIFRSQRRFFVPS